MNESEDIFKLKKRLEDNDVHFHSGEYNGGFISDSQSLAGSRKSLAMPSVMMVPQFQVPQPPPTPGGTLPPPEQYSDGQTPAGVPPPYGSYSQMQNFQL